MLVRPYEDDLGRMVLTITHRDAAGVERYRVTDENDQWYLKPEHGVDVPLVVVQAYAAAEDEQESVQFKLREALKGTRLGTTVSVL